MLMMSTRAITASALSTRPTGGVSSPKVRLMTMITPSAIGSTPSLAKIGKVIGAITSIIGMSVLSGSHIELTRQLLETLASSGASDIPVIVGGIIPPQDIQVLRDMGVKQVFTPADYDVISVFERIIDVLESRP